MAAKNIVTCISVLSIRPSDDGLASYFHHESAGGRKVNKSQVALNDAAQVGVSLRKNPDVVLRHIALGGNAKFSQVQCCVESTVDLPGRFA